METESREEPGSSSQQSQDQDLEFTLHTPPAELAIFMRSLNEAANRAQTVLDRYSQVLGSQRSPPNETPNQATAAPNNPTSSTPLRQLTTNIPTPASPRSPIPASQPTSLTSQVSNMSILQFVNTDSWQNPFLNDPNPQPLNLQNGPFPGTNNDSDCKALIFQLERTLQVYKNVEYDIHFLNSCLHHNIVPQGLRITRFPNGTTKDSPMYTELTKMFNDTGLNTLRILNKHNDNKLLTLKAEVEQLHLKVLQHQDFDYFRHLYDGISPRITRHTATLIHRKRNKLQRDLLQYQSGTAYLPYSERRFTNRFRRNHFHFPAATNTSNSTTPPQPPITNNNMPEPARQQQAGPPPLMSLHPQPVPTLLMTAQTQNSNSHLAPPSPRQGNSFNLNNAEGQNVFLSPAHWNQGNDIRTPARNNRGRGRGNWRYQNLGRPMLTRNASRNY